jgi:hypothetical protein
MTIVDDDPSLLPLVSLNIIFSYVSGSWRAIQAVLVKLTLSLTVVSQLHALLFWYMIGVSKIVLDERIIDVPLTCFPVLTFGQEVSRFTPLSSISLRMGL